MGKELVKEVEFVTAAAVANALARSCQIDCNCAKLVARCPRLNLPFMNGSTSAERGRGAVVY